MEICSSESLYDFSLKDEFDSPLLSGYTYEDNGIPLYDDISTLSVPFHVARGYYILMTGGKLEVPEVSKRKKGFFKRHGHSAAITGEQIDEEKKCDETTTCPGQQSEEEEKRDETTATPVQQSKEEKYDESTPGKDENMFEANFDDSIDELPEHLWIAWLALTDGNVIDCCFGIEANGGTRMIHDGKGSSPGSVLVKKVKAQLLSASESNPSLKILAVEAYCRCFKVVMEYHQEMEKLGPLGVVFCYSHRAITDDAREKLKNAFIYLVGAMEASL
jgi:hypothetical protein